MNLLYVSPYLTMPKIGAGVGSKSHLKALQECLPSENLTVVAINYTGEEVSGIATDTILLNSFRNQAEKIMNILSLNGICMNRRIRKQIIRIIKENQIDCVLIDESILGKLCYQIKKLHPSIRVVSFYHDVKANLCRQWLKHGGIKSLPYNLGLMINEKINVKYADTHIVLNEREADLFEKYYHKSPDFFLPHFTVEKNDAYMIAEEKRNDDNIELLFVGVDYKPNVDGIQWFIDAVMPYVNSTFALKIVGKGMEKYKDRLSRDNVTVIGTVENLAEWYTHADVVVSPIFDGGGMKTKSAEAFQYGKLFIATSESYEGYAENIPESFWNRLCWRADDSESFIRNLNMLAETEVCQYNQELRELYVNYYSLQAGVNCMKRILDLK